MPENKSANRPSNNPAHDARGKLTTALPGSEASDAHSLDRDRVFRGCKTIEYDGVSYPALGPVERCWAVLRRLGLGGMGVVYYGVHPRLRSAVAIKVLPPDQEDRHPVLADRFVQEARIAAQVHSAHLVRVFDVDRDAETEVRFFVMEYIHGVTAGKWLADFNGTGAPEKDALDVAIAATRGLAAVHDARVEAAPRGAVHRDVKPDNIFIPLTAASGRPDLGAAKLGDLGLSCPEDSSHEMTGDVLAMGTPGYASPEQLEDVTRAQRASDVFSMGATLYALLAGSAPFSDKERNQRNRATFEGRYKPLDTVRPDVSTATCELVRRCLQTEASKRFADAGALLDALQDCRRRVSRQANRLAKSESQTVDLGRFNAALAKTGRIVLLGGPPKATVVLSRSADGVTASNAALDGDGCATLQVVPGAYRIVVSEPMHEQFASYVAVGAGADAELRVPRQLRPGTLDIESDPPGAEVRVDDDVVGTTPVRAQSVPPGTRRVSLRRDGYVDVALQVEVDVGATSRVGPVILQTLPVFDAPGLPPDASLELDGRPVADGDAVQPGRYVLVARRRGFEPQRLELVFAPGTRVRPDFAAWRREAAPLLDDVADWDAATSAEREAAARAIERRLRGFVWAGLERFQSGDQAREVALYRHDETGVEFALLPGGRAVVGSTLDEDGHRPDERLRTVALGPFLCARAPVGERAWRTVLGRGPVRPPQGGAPVAATWDEASEFCRRAGFDLPTEWEREYAARAGTTSRFAFGDDAAAVAQRVWWIENALGRPRGAGQHPANAFGLFDVHGNVADWCADAYREDPDAPEPQSSGAKDPVYRTYRGGTCRDRIPALRSAARGAYLPSQTGLPIGVRPVVRIVPESRRTGVQPIPVVQAMTTDTTIPITAPAPVAIAVELADVARWRSATSVERSRAAQAATRLVAGFAFQGLQTFEAGGVRQEVAVFLHEATGIAFCLVPGGRAVVGSPEGERGRFPAETQRTVDVTPFLIARTAVTQQVWERVSGSNPSSFQGRDRPVECVTWDEAVAFCARTSLELPSEAQWEVACRAGTSTRFCCGDDEADLERYAWYEPNSGRTSRDVGLKLPNAFGLYDVHGNVWEWCSDVSAERAPSSDAASRSDRDVPVRRMVRGGGWAASAEYLRSAVRLAFAPTKRMATVGFRPSLSIVPRVRER